MRDDEGVIRSVPARSAGRAFDVLEFLSERSGPTSAGAISRHSGIPRSSLHYLLVLLRDRRYIAYNQSKRAWVLGPRIGELCSDSPLLTQGLAVLTAFESAPHSLGIREIAAATDLPRPVVVDIAAIMTSHGLLRAQPGGTYSPGLELVSLASRVSWVDRLRRLVNPHLVRLRDASGETANLVVLDDGHATYIDQVESRHSLRHSGWVGRHIPIEGTATGMALADTTKAHLVTDSIEAGVTAIVCGVKGANSPTAVGITGPTWRINEAGVRRVTTMVEAIARETGADLEANL